MRKGPEKASGIHKTTNCGRKLYLLYTAGMMTLIHLEELRTPIGWYYGKICPSNVYRPKYQRWIKVGNEKSMFVFSRMGKYKLLLELHQLKFIGQTLDICNLEIEATFNNSFIYFEYSIPTIDILTQKLLYYSLL